MSIVKAPRSQWHFNPEGCRCGLCDGWDEHHHEHLQCTECGKSGLPEYFVNGAHICQAMTTTCERCGGLGWVSSEHQQIFRCGSCDTFEDHYEAAAHVISQARALPKLLEAVETAENALNDVAILLHNIEQFDDAPFNSLRASNAKRIGLAARGLKSAIAETKSK